ncbi:hypothetical protein IV203_029407 [Nitzschia inconspicua]|uniref:Uncharacterized protein n=1 Tax=Nitzschia inconspicua TaxID=303405 RepID=A0A9K3LRC2_9STRA|nr:hypothetical protein IV203_029407 [Nitzschia inconspicua]
MNSGTYRTSSSSSSGSASSLGLLGEVASETINIQHTIQHVFTFRISDKWEKPLRRYMDKFLDLSLAYAESFRFISVGIGSFFFLWGVSKVVAAGNANERGGNSSGSSSSSKGKSKSSRKGPSDNATIATSSSRTTNRNRRRTTANQSDEENLLPSPPTTIAFQSIVENDETEETNE